MDNLKKYKYLGDGVYASFDGFYIRLHVNSHEAEPCVAIEPDVMRALEDYAKSVWSSPKNK